LVCKEGDGPGGAQKDVLTDKGKEKRQDWFHRFFSSFRGEKEKVRPKRSRCEPPSKGWRNKLSQITITIYGEKESWGEHWGGKGYGFHSLEKEKRAELTTGEPKILRIFHLLRV